MTQSIVFTAREVKEGHAKTLSRSVAHIQVAGKRYEISAYASDKLEWDSIVNHPKFQNDQEVVLNSIPVS